jgi:hypothetical protein
VAGALASPQAGLALISQPVIEAEATGPRKAAVLWDVPSEAGENGDKIVASWELDLADNFSFTDATTAALSADTLSHNLDRDDGLVSIKQYYVRVRALYTDASTSNYGSTYFYTKIGKVQNLRTKDKTQTSATLKWDKTVREGDSMTYEVKVYRKTKLILDESVFGKGYLAIDDLRADTRYNFKVRARYDSKYGIGKWSDVQYFRTLE